MFRRGTLVLTPPTFAVFAVSLILAAMALLMHYSSVSIPLIRSSHAFDLLAIGYVLLTIGVLFRRL